MRIQRLYLFLVILLLAAGCGNSNSSGGFSSNGATIVNNGTTTVPSTTANLRLDLQFDPAQPRLNRLPASSQTIVIQVINADTGAREIQLPTVTRTGDQQIVSAAGLNPGRKTIHVVVFDSSGVQIGHQDLSITLVAGETATVVVDNLIPDNLPASSPSPQPSVEASPQPGASPSPAAPVASPSPGGLPVASPSPSVTVRAVFLRPADPLVEVGASLNITMGLALSDGTTQDVTSQAVFVSSDSLVAAFTQPGVVKGLSPGIIPITATFNGLTATATLQVIAPSSGIIPFNPPPAATPTPSQIGSKWTSVLQAVTLNGLTFGANQYVAVGRQGTILTSSDAAHWVTRVLPSSSAKNLNGVAFGNGVYVAVGNNGTIFTSSDGIAWTTRTSNVGAKLNAVAFGNNTFAAVGAGGTLTTSSDNGATWVKQRDIASQELLAVTYGNGLFVATGYNPDRSFTSNTPIYTTDDVTARWASRDSAVTGDLYGITYRPDNTSFVAVGDLGGNGIVTFSGNGRTWRAPNQIKDSPGRLTSVVWNGSQFVATTVSGGSSTIYVSNNGSGTWKAATNPPCGCEDMLAVAFGAGVTTAVGEKGKIVTAPDGNTWSLRTPFNGVALNAIAFGSGIYAAVGKGGILDYSPDGSAWAPPVLVFPPPPYFPFALGFDLTAVAIGNGQVVLFGSGSLIDVPIATLPNVDPAQLQFGFVPSGDTIHGAGFFNNQFYAVGNNGTIINSTDGLNFNNVRRSGTNRNLFGIGYGNGTYVAVGANGVITTSTDGNRFNNVTTPVPGVKLTSVTYGNGRWAAVGDGGTIITSVDAATWTAVTPAPTGLNLASVAFGSGLFIATGDSGVAVTSPDGVNWNAGPTGLSNNLNGIVYGLNQFVTVGAGENILTSP